MAAFKINDRVRVKKQGLKSTGQVGTVTSLKWDYYITVRLDDGNVINVKEHSLEKESKNQRTMDSVIFQLTYAAWDNEDDYDDVVYDNSIPMTPKDVVDALSKFGSESDTFFSAEEVKEEIEERLGYWDNVAGFVNGEMFHVHKTTVYAGKLFE